MSPREPWSGQRCATCRMVAAFIVPETRERVCLRCLALRRAKLEPEVGANEVWDNTAFAHLLDIGTS